MERERLFTEGSVKLLISEKEPVFYNPRGALARTLGVLALRVLRDNFGEAIIAADAFTGSGIRAIRYVKEGGALRVYANDSSPFALEVAERNALLNKVRSRIKFSSRESIRFLWSLKEREVFPHFLDIDPYGSPAPFMEAALLASRIGGYVYITATDLAPLCGIRREAAFRNYGALTARTDFCHEAGARIVIGTAQRIAGRHASLFRPLMTYYDGSALRILLRTERGRENFPGDLIGFTAHCPRCKHRTGFRMKGKWTVRCEKCSTELEIIGPLWLGDLHDREFLERLKSKAAEYDGREGRKIAGLLDKMEGEIGMPPYYFDIARVSDMIDVRTPSTEKVIELLKRAGFRASRTHFNGRGIKTDASISALADLMPRAL
ncbi:MAG TPA: tRNA (guanine(10)-N(2))-dimethyltransferase [candidate division WOR-3 bacterium]|uniref:tRNA (guanine(26)-N(2))-dimethyltransferase n=1 Tax=candidate division WOR-3 bacterium TaxID=2052148 RepID=A0A7C0XB50_UNCW3|nr:tRNA (guanine(10)-N(2))-dimethyltransferase [candidate division WOR-3 bacterium]